MLQLQYSGLVERAAADSWLSSLWSSNKEKKEEEEEATAKRAPLVDDRSGYDAAVSTKAFASRPAPDFSMSAVAESRAVPFRWSGNFIGVDPVRGTDQAWCDSNLESENYTAASSPRNNPNMICASIEKALAIAKDGDCITLADHSVFYSHSLYAPPNTRVALIGEGSNVSVECGGNSPFITFTAPSLVKSIVFVNCDVTGAPFKSEAGYFVRCLDNTLVQVTSDKMTSMYASDTQKMDYEEPSSEFCERTLRPFFDSLDTAYPQELFSSLSGLAMTVTGILALIYQCNMSTAILFIYATMIVNGIGTVAMHWYKTIYTGLFDVIPMIVMAGMGMALILQEVVEHFYARKRTKKGKKPGSYGNEKGGEQVWMCICVGFSAAVVNVAIPTIDSSIYPDLFILVFGSILAVSVVSSWVLFPYLFGACMKCAERRRRRREGRRGGSGGEGGGGGGEEGDEEGGRGEEARQARAEMEEKRRELEEWKSGMTKEMFFMSQLMRVRHVQLSNTISPLDNMCNAEKEALFYLYSVSEKGSAYKRMVITYMLYVVLSMVAIGFKLVDGMLCPILPAVGYVFPHFIWHVLIAYSIHCLICCVSYLRANNSNYYPIIRFRLRFFPSVEWHLPAHLVELYTQMREEGGDRQDVNTLTKTLETAEAISTCMQHYLYQEKAGKQRNNNRAVTCAPRRVANIVERDGEEEREGERRADGEGASARIRRATGRWMALRIVKNTGDDDDDEVWRDVHDAVAHSALKLNAIMKVKVVGDRRGRRRRRGGVEEDRTPVIQLNSSREGASPSPIQS